MAAAVGKAVFCYKKLLTHVSSHFHWPRQNDFVLEWICNWSSTGKYLEIVETGLLIHLTRLVFLRALCGALSLYKYLNWKSGLPEAWIHLRKCTLKETQWIHRRGFCSHSLVYVMLIAPVKLWLFLGSKCCLATHIQLVVVMYVVPFVTYFELSRWHRCYLSVNRSQIIFWLYL